MNRETLVLALIVAGTCVPSKILAQPRSNRTNGVEERICVIQSTTADRLQFDVDCNSHIDSRYDLVIEATRFEPPDIYRTLWEEVKSCLAKYPEINIELVNLTDIKFYSVYSYTRSGFPCLLTYDIGIRKGMCRGFYFASNNAILLHTYRTEDDVKHEMAHALGLSINDHGSRAMRQCADFATQPLTRSRQMERMDPIDALSLFIEVRNDPDEWTRQDRYNIFQIASAILEKHSNKEEKKLKKRARS